MITALYVVSSKKNKIIDLVVLSIILLSYMYLVPLRPSDAGNDTALYINAYTKLYDFNSAYEVGKSYFGNTEPLFWPLSFVLKMIGLSAAQFIAACGLISFFLTYNSLKLQAEILRCDRRLVFFSLAAMLFTYMSVYYGNHVRASLAVPLAFMSVLYYIKRDSVKAVLFFLLAMSFHWSSLFIALYILIDKFIDTEKKIFIAYLLSCFTALVSSFVINELGSILSFFPQLSNFKDKVELYKSGTVASELTSIFSLSSFWAIFIVASIFILYRDPKNIRVRKLSLLFLILVMVFSFSPIMSVRYFSFLYVTSVLGFTSVFVNVFGKKVALMLLFLLFIILSFVVLTSESVRYTLGLN
ncbi:EpsG family protein [Pseudoalteromonas gelatinilytica]|nr:EpsG family protein [Pseudoalteromonas profundi]